MQDYKKLNVWQISFEFVADVYRVTKSFPKQELYSLTSQMQRAAVSISSNIAEGAARGTGADFARFLDIALGSAFEIECQILIAQKLDYLQHNDFNSLYAKIDEIKKMLSSLIRSIRDSKT